MSQETAVSLGQEAVPMSQEVTSVSQNKVVMYSSRFCPFCFRAKALLEQKNASINEIMVDQEPQIRQKMMQDSGRHTVPQIWIGEQHIGGCDELMALERSNKLEAMLSA